MTNVQIVILSAICVAFGVFTALLVWGDYQTRNIGHRPAAAPRRKSLPAVVGTKATSIEPATIRDESVEPIVAAY